MLVVLIIALGLSLEIKNQAIIYQNPTASSTPVSDDQKPALQTLQETNASQTSPSAFWWLSSGGFVYISTDGNSGATFQGALSENSKWRMLYATNNPADTDGGIHPQNIFRLVTKSRWQNFTQEAYFLIAKDNLSASANRNSSNGILFFNRDQDSQNLYYTGLRVDGYAVIKKKLNGVYYTLAEKPFITGSVYDKGSNPNLLPRNSLIGLRSIVQNNQDGAVSIKLYVDNGRTGNWVLAAEATDDGKSYGGAAITQSGYAGIRTDFMDVLFDDYKLSNL